MKYIMAPVADFVGASEFLLEGRLVPILGFARIVAEAVRGQIGDVFGFSAHVRNLFLAEEADRQGCREI